MRLWINKDRDERKIQQANLIDEIIKPVNYCRA